MVYNFPDPVRYTIVNSAYIARCSAHGLFLAATSLACTQELDIALPTAPPQLVLNGFLHPDSIIRISLTTTLPSSTSSDDFPVVDDADVRLYEDNELIGNSEFQDSVYMLDYYPKVGREYSVEVSTLGYPTIRASDVVPNSPIAEICFWEDTVSRYVFSSAILDITIRDPAEEQNFYWIDITGTRPAWPRCSLKRDSIVWTEEGFLTIPLDTIVCDDNGLPTFSSYRWYRYQSFSTVPDRFNAYIDNVAAGVTEYQGYVRVEDATLNGESIVFDLAGGDYDYLVRYPRVHDQLAVTATFVNASQHYDRYLKSSITYHLNRQYSEDEDIGFKPFVQSSQVYSNVENGTGIFAAYNSVDLDIGSYPCE